MNYKYLVIAALQEELIEFTKLCESQPVLVGQEIEKVDMHISNGDRTIEVGIFSSNKMGMPYNGAKLMQIILTVDPEFVFFIGTCAGIGQYKIGAVLIPSRVFSYESGKYENGAFYPDYIAYDTSDVLRKQVGYLVDPKKGMLDFDIITDCEFCSGSAVINDETIIENIKQRGGRKLAGLDMESFSIACISQILRNRNELIVIKGISDLAKEKSKSESQGKKELAKINAATITYEFIRFLEEKTYSKTVHEILQISPFGSYQETATFPLKLNFKIENKSRDIAILQSKNFVFQNEFNLDPRAGLFSKPLFKVGVISLNGQNKDDYRDICVIKPGDLAISCWIPIEKSVTIENLKSAILEKRVGFWNYEWFLNNDFPFRKSGKFIT